MGESAQPGWYPDPYDNTSEVYWTGTQWHGRRQKFASVPQQYPQQSQVPPKKNSSTAVWWGLALAVLIIIFLVVAYSGPSYEETECRKSLSGQGFTGQKLDDLVQTCVRVAKDMNK